MKIKDNIIDDIAVVSINEENIGQLESGELHKHINNLMADDIKKFVIDLSKVKWLSSSGLGDLVASRNTVLKNRGNLKLVGATKNVQNLLTLTRLIQIFEITDTVEQAIASFKS